MTYESRETIRRRGQQTAPWLCLLLFVGPLARGTFLGRGRDESFFSRIA